MKSKFRRIFITGASGTGKTTMAKLLSSIFDIPFISTSAKKLYPRYGFIDHRHSIIKSINDPYMGLNFQNDILNDRLTSIKNMSSFISDRSPFDNYAHFLLQGGFLFDNNEVRDFAYKASKGLSKADLVIFIRYSDDIALEDDSMRIHNPDYQRVIDSTIDMTIKKQLVPIPNWLSILEINTWDMEERERILIDYMSE